MRSTPRNPDGPPAAVHSAGTGGRAELPVGRRHPRSTGLAGPRVVTWLPPDEMLPASLLRAALQLIPCDSGPAVAEAGVDADALILDLHLAGRWLQADVARRLILRTPTLLRGDLTPSVSRTIVQLSRWNTDAAISLRHVDDLAADLVHLLRHADASDPSLRMLRAALPVASAETLPVLVGVTALGQRRTTLPELARHCGLSPRALEYRLQRAALPHASVLLGWCVSLHTLWRMEALGWSLKRCATTAGMSEAAGLSEYINRHVQQRPQALLASGGFAAVLDRWHTLLRLA